MDAEMGETREGRAGELDAAVRRDCGADVGEGADRAWEVLRTHADATRTGAPASTGCRAEGSCPEDEAGMRMEGPRMPIPIGKWLNDDGAVPMSSAKTHLSRLAAHANETGESITVVRDGVPWIELRPLAYRPV